MTTSLSRHRDFLLLWAGETASQVGTRIGQVAAPLLAVTALGATPWQMGLLTAAQTAGFLLVGLLAGVRAAVLVLFLVRELGLSASLVGLLLAATGVSALAGALTASRWTRRFGQGRTIVLALLVTAPLSLLVPAAGPGAWLVPAAVGLFAEGYGAVVYNVAQVSFRQAVCPDRLLGRMNASVRFLVWGAIPIGGLAGGGLAELLGARATLVVAAAGALLAPVAVLASPLRGLRDLPRGPAPG